MIWLLLAALAAAPATDDRDAKLAATEQRLIAASGGAVKRRGPVLTIGSQTWRNEGRCFDDDSQCVEYRADRRWGSYVGVLVSMYESSEYLLINTSSAHFVYVGDRPITSPSGLRFFVGSHSDAGWDPLHGAAVWKFRPTPSRLRVVDTDLVMFERFEAWHGDDCVAFRGARGYGVKLQPIQTFWLYADAGDWRVTDRRPSVCR